jgi:hypothetical protein
MKKIKSTALLVVLFATFSITSCTKDNPNSDNSYGTSTGDYYPMALDNQWTMSQNATEMAPTKIIGTDNFGGTTYYKLSNALSGADLGSTMGFDMQTWIAKKGAAYFSKIGDMTITQDDVTVKMNGYEIQILKDNLAVGESWNQTLPIKITVSAGGQSQSLEMPTKYTGTILEKNVQVTLNGVSYPDVIKVNMKQEMTIQDPTSVESETIVIDEEDWYANGVGPIKRITTSNGKTLEAILVNYVVKE